MRLSLKFKPIYLYESAFFHVIFILLWLINPFVSTVLFAVYLTQRSIRNNSYDLYIILVSALFALIAYTTQSISDTDTDIVRYYESYTRLADVASFNDLILAQVVDGDLNIVFTTVNLMLAKIFPENYQVLPLVWVFITYYFSLSTSLRYCRELSFTSFTTVMVLVFSFLGCIFFYQTTENIKQTAATAIFGYALVTRWAGNKRKANIFLVISILTHLSAFFFVPIFFLFNKPIFKYRYAIFLITVALSFFNFNYLLALFFSNFFSGLPAIATRLEAYQEYTDWYLNLRYVSILFFVTLIFLYIAILVESNKGRINHRVLELYHIVMLGFCFWFMNRSNPHNFIRYSASYFPFYTLFIILVAILKKRDSSASLYMFLLGLIFMYLNFSHLRSLTLRNGTYANSYINGSILNLFKYTSIDYLSVKVKL